MQNIYVIGAEPDSGKAVVALGLCEMLSTIAPRIGFFRPVVPEPGADDLTGLVRERYGISAGPELSWGCSAEDARELASKGQYQRLLKTVLEKFKRLEAETGVVVCVGTDFSVVVPSLTFQFNTDLANNLGCQVASVISGQQRSPEQVCDALRLNRESLRARGCEVLAQVVNRVPAENREEVGAAVREALPETEIAGVLPDQPVLDQPTVREIAREFGARCLSGDAQDLNQVVRGFRVAAMQVPHFLDYVDEGALIITPGDRADIILAAMLAHESPEYPSLAGLLLTGGLDPAPQLKKVLEGRASGHLPVLEVSEDTFAASLRASRTRPAILPGDDRKIAAALGLMDAHIDTDRLRRRLEARRPSRVTPLMFEYELVRQARTECARIVLPEGTDDRILRAAEILQLRGVADLVLLGDPDRIRLRAGELGVDPGPAELIDPRHSPHRERFADTYHELRRHKGISREMARDAMADVSYFGTMMVHHGLADGMVSGAAHTTQHTIRPAFEIIRTQPGVRLVSSVFFMCLPDRVLVYGDCAVNPNPDAEQLADIAVTSARTAQRFGVEPRVAMLSYSTGSSGKGEDVERVREAVAIARALAPGLGIEGPIQYDAAVDASVARSKMPDSEVAGRASVFIFPDLNTGNNTYKAVQRSAGAVAIGPVLQGLNKPVNDLSRGCTVTDIVNTVAITAIQSRGQSGEAAT